MKKLEFVDMDKHTIVELMDFVKRTRGVGSAKNLYSTLILPFLISVNESYSDEELKKLDEQYRCINPKCGTKDNLTFHHLFPKLYRHDYIRKKQIPNRGGGILICRKCHNIFHDSKKGSEIFANYTTEESVINFFINECDDALFVV